MIAGEAIRQVCSAQNRDSSPFLFEQAVVDTSMKGLLLSWNQIPKILLARGVFKVIFIGSIKSA